MDIIVIAAGLTILLARDVYRTVRRKRRERKLKKTLLSAGIDPAIYSPAEYAYITSSSRQYYDYRDHMHRFHHPPPGVPIARPRTRGQDRAAVGGGRYGFGEYGFGRSRTMDGSEYVERMGTPPPPYTPPPRMSSEFTSGAPASTGRGAGGAGEQTATDSGLNLTPSSTGAGMIIQHVGPPPPFEHAYTADASGMEAEGRRKEQGLETVAEYGEYRWAWALPLLR